MYTQIVCVSIMFIFTCSFAIDSMQFKAENSDLTKYIAFHFTNFFVSHLDEPKH